MCRRAYISVVRLIFWKLWVWPLWLCSVCTLWEACERPHYVQWMSIMLRQLVFKWCKKWQGLYVCSNAPLSLCSLQIEAINHQCDPYFTFTQHPYRQQWGQSMWLTWVMLWTVERMCFTSLYCVLHIVRLCLAIKVRKSCKTMIYFSIIKNKQHRKRPWNKVQKL